MSLPRYPITVERTGRDIAVTLTTRVDAEIEQVFDFTAAEDVLPKVLTGYSPFLPAVVSTSGNTGPWDIPGSSRLVHLKDGSRAVEEVTAYERPTYFAYKSSQFTFALRYLAHGAAGQWWFTDDHGGPKCVGPTPSRQRACSVRSYCRSSPACYGRAICALHFTTRSANSVQALRT